MNNTDIAAHMALVKKWHDDVLSPWEDQSWEAVEASARKLAAPERTEQAAPEADALYFDAAMPPVVVRPLTASPTAPSTEQRPQNCGTGFCSCIECPYEPSTEASGPVKRCPYCDDTGDVHSIDGEWRGTCNCPAARTTPPPAPVLSDAEIEPSDADWADFGAWAGRDKGAMDLLEKLIDVWDDGQLPYEHRCYVDGAWSELIAEAKSMVEQAIGRASREAK